MRRRLAAVGMGLMSMVGLVSVNSTPVSAALAPVSPTSPSGTNSMVVLSRITCPADGRTETVVIVTINDQFGNPVSGKTIEVTDGSPDTVELHPLSIDGSVPGVTNDSGVAEFGATDTAAEVVTFTATDATDGMAVVNQPTESFQTPVTPPAETPEIVAPALLPLWALGLGGITYGVGRRRSRRDVTSAH
jgi:hypothetical protein